MEVALTFGSLGDIIQLCQLAIQLGRAVGVGCGAVGESVKEYQELRDDLDFSVRILTQVVATYEKHELSPYLSDLDQASKSVVNQTASLIQDALDHFQSRYQNSLHPEGSGKKLIDAYKKLEWSTREKERIRCLREKLQESVQRLQLLASLAARKSARVDNAALLDRVTEVRTLLSKTYASQEEMLRLIQQRNGSGEQVRKPDETSQMLVQQDNNSHSVLAVAGDALRAILQVKDLLIQVSQDAINVDMVFNSTHLRPMDLTNGLPAIIEDALGRHVPIPPNWLDFLDWEALYALLSCHFKGQNGHDMVIRRAYALEESASGRDLDSERPLHLCLRRGMKINMSMIFETTEPLSGTCPRCKTEQDAPEGVTVQCPNSDCGMWFSMRRMDSNQTTSTKHGESVNLGTTAVSSTIVNPADFQRVRFFCHNTSVTKSIILTPTIAANTSVKKTLYHSLFRTSSPRKRIVWTWCCCYCGHGGTRIWLDPCPNCGVPRCPNCPTQRSYGRVT